MNNADSYLAGVQAFNLLIPTLGEGIKSHDEKWELIARDQERLIKLGCDKEFLKGYEEAAMAFVDISANYEVEVGGGVVSSGVDGIVVLSIDNTVNLYRNGEVFGVELDEMPALIKRLTYLYKVMDRGGRPVTQVMRDLYLLGNRIGAIKAYRSTYDVGLKVAKDALEAWYKSTGKAE